MTENLMPQLEELHRKFGLLYRTAGYVVSASGKEILKNRALLASAKEMDAELQKLIALAKILKR